MHFKSSQERGLTRGTPDTVGFLGVQILAWLGLRLTINFNSKALFEP
jgi:hypothetical protein